MGYLRFWRRIRIAPWLTLNLSKKGLSASLGPRGARVTLGKKGVRSTVGLAGTGLHYTSHSPYQSRSGQPALTMGEEVNENMSSLEQALVALEENDRHAALAALRQVDSPQAHLLTGYILLSLGSPTTALKHLAEADSPLGHFLRGYLFLGENFPTRAAKEFQATDLSLIQKAQSFESHLAEMIQVTCIVSHRHSFTASVTRLVHLVMYLDACVRSNLLEQTSTIRELLLDEFPDALIAKYAAIHSWELCGQLDEEIDKRIVLLTDKLQNETELHAELLLCKAKALKGLGMTDASLHLLTNLIRKTSNRSQDFINEARYERALIRLDDGGQGRARADLEAIFADDCKYKDVAERLGLQVELQEHEYAGAGPVDEAESPFRRALMEIDKEHNALLLFKTLVLVKKADGQTPDPESSSFTSAGCGLTRSAYGNMFALISETEEVHLDEVEGDRRQKIEFLSELCLCAQMDGPFVESEIEMIRLVGEALDVPEESIATSLRTSDLIMPDFIE